MSRSYQKTPIKGHTNCQSERLDKRLWHKRGRKHERIKLAAISSENLDDHCTTDRREVSNPWDMGKDGKSYFPKNKQMQLAEVLSQRQAHNHKEHSALKKRILHKLTGK